MEDLPKETDDNNDLDWDDEFSQPTNTSTSIERDYLGYEDYEKSRERAEWDNPPEPMNAGERDDDYDRMRDARQELKRYYPDYDPNGGTFNVKFGENGGIEGRLSTSSNNVWHTLVNENGDLNIENLPKTFRKELGGDYETMLEKFNNKAYELNQSNEKNRELENTLEGLNATLEVYPQEISRYEEKEIELRKFIEGLQQKNAENKSLFEQTAKQNIEIKIQAQKTLEEIEKYKEEIEKYKKGKSNEAKLKQSNDRLKSENEKLKDQLRNKTISNNEQLAEIDGRKDEIFKNLPLREKIKYIFKKYGFTVFAVLSAVGAVIGVIVSSLSKGLTTLGRNLGNGLKTLGKKLGQILPGMVGAIVSFLFKTAGQVIGFLGENAWLLIMAVVLYFVESMKKKRK